MRVSIACSIILCHLRVCASNTVKKGQPSCTAIIQQSSSGCNGARTLLPENNQCSTYQYRCGNYTILPEHFYAMVYVCTPDLAKAACSWHQVPYDRCLPAGVSLYLPETAPSGACHPSFLTPALSMPPSRSDHRRKAVELNFVTQMVRMEKHSNFLKCSMYRLGHCGLPRW